MKYRDWFSILTILISGCGPHITYSTILKQAETIDASIQQANDITDEIKLGTSRIDVLALLEPIQSNLPAKARKSSERFMRDGKEIFVYFLRSGRQPDNLTTDDEFTPYVFENDKLIGIGWSLLGGPKTHGQVRQPDTNINVNQETTIR